jgi:hypothetical protein
MIQDGVPITTLERAVSTDIVNAQELGMRMSMELQRAAARHYETVAGGAPAAPVRTHLASGLNIQQSGGTTITMNAGMLAQQISPSPPDVPAPEALDSSYRVGLQLQAADVTDPWDGTGSYWLLEARVERETTLSEVRDIYNPGTSTFSPSAAAIDKRYEAQIETQWIKDPVSFATQLPVGTAGWAPIGGCWRPAVFAAITDADVFNLSVQLEDLAGHTTDDGRAVRTDLRMYTNLGIDASSPNVIHCLAGVAQGLGLFAQTEDAQVSDFRDATIMEAASAAALQTGGVWGYVYLAPLSNRMPSGLHPNIHHRGALIVSRTAPDYYGRNSAPITAPAPLVENVPTGGAVHVGCIQSDGVANWRYVDCSSVGEARCEKRAFENGAFPLNLGNLFVGPGGPTHDLRVNGTGGTEDVPYGVAHRCYLDLEKLDTTAVAVGIEIVFGYPGDGALATAMPRMIMATQATTGYVFELHPRSSNLTLTVTAYARSATLASIAIDLANTQTNEYRAGIYGFRF